MIIFGCLKDKTKQNISIDFPIFENYFVQAKVTCGIKLDAGLLHKILLLQPTLLTFHYITYMYIACIHTHIFKLLDNFRGEAPATTIMHI